MGCGMMTLEISDDKYIQNAHMFLLDTKKNVTLMNIQLKVYGIW